MTKCLWDSKTSFNSEVWRTSDVEYQSFYFEGHGRNLIVWHWSHRFYNDRPGCNFLSSSKDPTLSPLSSEKNPEYNTVCLWSVHIDDHTCLRLRAASWKCLIYVCKMLSHCIVQIIVSWRLGQKKSLYPADFLLFVWSCLSVSRWQMKLSHAPVILVIGWTTGGSVRRFRSSTPKLMSWSHPLHLTRPS